ncbi:MAG: FkbM family methyltransferase [Betaproteobacteria bacterium]|nr:FkbM family methyltransferase [Betaproteobacteria bacterium]
MIRFGKGIVKSTLRKFGVDIHKHAPDVSPSAQIAAALRKFEIDLILDVGANQGQFASETRACGYAGNIVSFEPLSAAHAALLQLSAGDPKWSVHPRCALGARNGETEINIAGNSASSSLLPMLDSHIQAAPYAAYIGSEFVTLQTLDSIALEHVTKFKNPFLKVDTQGFEWEVLDGAMNVLPHLRGILLELTLVPLYQGQHLWRELISRLEVEGFSLWALQPGFTDPRDGRTLQADGLFIRL